MVKVSFKEGRRKMKTIRVAKPWAIRDVAKALEITPEDLIEKMCSIWRISPNVIKPCGVLDDDMAKIMCLKYSCYIEELTSSQSDS